MAMQPGFTFGNPMTRTVFIALALIVCTLFCMLLVLFKHDLFEKYGFFKRLEHKASIGALIHRAYAAVRLCITHPALVAKGLTLSVAGQVAGVTAAFCLSRAVGMNVPFIDFFSLYLIVLCVTAVPLTPGALGVREAAMVFMMKTADVPEVSSVALSLLIYAGTLACGAVGALVFICLSGPQGRAPAAEAPGPAHP